MKFSLFGDARRRPIVRRVDNFKTKPRRLAVHCAKITGKQGKRGNVDRERKKRDRYGRLYTFRLFVRWRTTRERRRGLEGGEERRGSALLSRVYEIPVPGLDRLIDRVDCQRFHPERRSPRDARQKKPCRYALLRSDATRARVRFPPRYATHFSSPIPPSRRDELSHPEMRPTAVTGE